MRTKNDEENGTTEPDDQSTSRPDDKSTTAQLLLLSELKAQSSVQRLQLSSNIAELPNKVTLSQ